MASNTPTHLSEHARIIEKQISQYFEENKLSANEAIAILDMIKNLYLTFKIVELIRLDAAKGKNAK